MIRLMPTNPEAMHRPVPTRYHHGEVIRLAMCSRAEVSSGRLDRADTGVMGGTLAMSATFSRVAMMASQRMGWSRTAAVRPADAGCTPWLRNRQRRVRRSKIEVFSPDSAVE